MAPFKKKSFPPAGNDSFRLPTPHAFSFPYAGIIQIRFNGCNLRPVEGHPVCGLLYGMYLNERPRTVKTQDLGLSNEN